MQGTVGSGRFGACSTVRADSMCSMRLCPSPLARSLKAIIAASMLLAASNGTPSALAADEDRTPSSATYHRVVELVFGSPECDRSTSSYSLLMRFLPTQGPESQILICRHKKGDFEVTYQVTPENIDHRILEIYRWTGREDPQEMAAKIKTAKTTVEVNQLEMRRLMTRYSGLRFSPLFDTSVIMDGASYQLWFTAASNKAHYSLSGSLNGSLKDPPLVRWMAEVRYFVDQSQLRGPGTPRRGRTP